MPETKDSADDNDQENNKNRNSRTRRSLKNKQQSDGEKSDSSDPETVDDVKKSKRNLRTKKPTENGSEEGSKSKDENKSPRGRRPRLTSTSSNGIANDKGNGVADEDSDSAEKEEEAKNDAADEDLDRAKDDEEEKKTRGANKSTRKNNENSEEEKNGDSDEDEGDSKKKKQVEKSRLSKKSLRERKGAKTNKNSYKEKDVSDKEGPDSEKETKGKKTRLSRSVKKNKNSDNKEQDVSDKDDANSDQEEEETTKDKGETAQVNRTRRSQKTAVSNKSNEENDESDEHSEEEQPKKLRNKAEERKSGKNLAGRKSLKEVEEEDNDVIEDDDTSSGESKQEKEDETYDPYNDNEADTGKKHKPATPTRISPRKLPKKKLAEYSDESESSDEEISNAKKRSLRNKKTMNESQRPVRSTRRKRARSASSVSSSSSVEYISTTTTKRTKLASDAKKSSSAKMTDIDLTKIDPALCFENVGGLQSHIRYLKEAVVFPMMYPETFKKLHHTPIRRLLFHGPSGTGKTLLAQTLASECNRGKKKVAFFMQNGSECLSTKSGETERRLRQIFERAERNKPSIIFFDDIDGLIPEDDDRSSSQIFSTFLAYMDGLSDKKDVIINFLDKMLDNNLIFRAVAYQVVIICATNRINAMDPTLRKLGRFDKELVFTFPDAKERLDILKIHTSKWKSPPDDDLLEVLAEKSIGYSAEDLLILSNTVKLRN